VQIMKRLFGIEIGACLIAMTMCTSAPALAAHVAASSQIVQHGVDYAEALKARTANEYIREHGTNYLCGHVSMNEYTATLRANK
jgi:hypothetical protein